MRALTVVLALGACVLGGCGSSDGDDRAGSAPLSAAAVVHIKDFAFSPAVVQVESGMDVRVTNDDDAAHTLTADDGAFDTGNVDGGTSATVTVTGSGTVSYHCELHDYMKGTIEIS